MLPFCWIAANGFYGVGCCALKENLLDNSEIMKLQMYVQYR